MTAYTTIGSGTDDPGLQREALQMLEETSRTFFIPISRLPGGLQQAVGSAYLCLRAIDEIEDHKLLTGEIKALLLRNISRVIQSSGERLRVEDLLLEAAEFRPVLAEVTLRLPDWLAIAPRSIASRIWDATATMADRMADWASENFRLTSEADLDRYTMGVAGAVGLVLSDLWAWFDGTQSDRTLAVGFRARAAGGQYPAQPGGRLPQRGRFFPDGLGGEGDAGLRPAQPFSGGRVPELAAPRGGF